MNKLRVAVLEDDPRLLKELVGRLRASGLVDVVDHARDGVRFIEMVNTKCPEALILDIDLVGEPDGGLRVARRLALPVLFISGHVGKNLPAIELLDAQRTRLPVAHLSKTSSDEVLRSRLTKFADEVRALRSQKRITLREKGKGSTVEVSLDAIVAIKVDAGSASSNNKIVFFSDRKPIRLADVTLSRLEDFGIPKGAFQLISRDCAVNRAQVLEHKSSEVTVRYMQHDGTMVTKRLEIKEAYRSRPI